MTHADQNAKPKPRRPSMTKTSLTKHDPNLADQARHSNQRLNTATHPLRFKPLLNPSEPSPANPSHRSMPIQTHHQSIPTQHHVQIKPRT